MQASQQFFTFFHEYRLILFISKGPSLIPQIDFIYGKRVVIDLWKLSKQEILVQPRLGQYVDRDLIRL